MNIIDFIEEIRDWLRDKSELNLLIGDEESNDLSVQKAIRKVISVWNSTSPLIYTFNYNEDAGTINIDTVDNNVRDMFIQGAGAQVIKTVMNIRARNSLNYVENGITVNDQELPLQEYKQLYNLYWSEFLGWLKSYKVAKNLEIAMGGTDGIHSEYFNDSSTTINY